MMDTAKVPASLPVAPAPLEDVGKVDVGKVDVARSRAVRRRERQQLRRQRRLYALGSIAVLVSALGATIYVVDVLR